MSKTLFNTEKRYLLFTTCGHLVHESCLIENIENDDQYGTKYNCFLCKAISNMRIPKNECEFNSEKGINFYNELKTIISLQSEKFSEERN